MSEKGEYVPSPRPNPRLRPEGAAYAERNRGTMERWFDYSDAYNNSSSGGGGSGGKANGTAEGDHAGSHAPWAETERPGLDAERSMTSRQEGGVGKGQMADSLEEGAMQDLMEKSSELSLSSVRGPAEEAKEYAERNRGTMDHIINNYRVATPPESPGGRQEAPRGTSTQGTDTELPPPAEPQSPRQRSLHQESQGRTWDETRPAPRIRPDGESIAMKNSADSMFGIMSNETNTQDSLTKPTGPHSSRHSQESATPPQSANQPRARPGDGMKNYEKAHDQSEMAAILRGEGDSSRAAPTRNIRHLQRSELW